MKKFISVFTAMFIFLFSSGVLAAEFSDVKSGDWYYQSISALTSQGYLNGYGNGTFKPNAKINRAEFATILAKASGDSLTDHSSSFDDVPSNHWGYNYIGWALDKGITSGKGNNKFCPDDTITRQEMVTMIYRYKNYKGQAPAITGEPYYSDFASVADYAKDPLRALYSYGGISGIGNNTFAPNATATRAEAAQIIYNCLILNDRQRTTVFARNFVDFKYVSGGASPEAGFDAEGFVKYVYAHFGVSLSGSVNEFMTVGSEVSRNNLNMGDMVCFILATTNLFMPSTAPMEWWSLISTQAIIKAIFSLAGGYLTTEL
ncbi:MAG: S-layer homology domain-containing protein [Bacillota bacterium]|nr:S-layer homology domain-containing protein [Bacillota bacterium]